MRDHTDSESDVDLQQLMNDVKVMLRDGQELLRVCATTVGRQAKVGAESAERWAKERPYHALAVAFGVGLLFGMLSGSARGRRRNDNYEDTLEGLQERSE
jgi:ElaB/YqjD/DUF883 family membrane-anchored ribosome-binding protein